MSGILLTGFAPFGGEEINPSWEAVRRLDAETIAGRRIAALLLPCIYAAARDTLEKAALDKAPELLLGVGQAGGRAELSVERLAVNLDDAATADEAGVAAVDRPVVAGGPAAYFASVPVKRMVARLREAGIPAGASMSAGSFVCNHVFYAACHMAAARMPEMKVGFVHLPFLPGQAARRPGIAPSMALESMIEGLRVALAAALEPGEDLAAAAGHTH